MKYRSIPHEISAVRYHAPRPADQTRVPGLGLAGLAGQPYKGNVAAVAELLDVPASELVVGEDGSLTVPDAAGFGPDTKLPDLYWVVRDAVPSICTHEHFVATYQTGGVSELEKLPAYELAERLFDADLKILRSSPAVGLLSHTDEMMFRDSDEVERWTQPAVLAMLHSAGRTGFTQEQLDRAGDRCSNRYDGDDDDDYYGAEMAREELLSSLARAAHGWFVEVQWASRRAWKGHVGSGWGVTRVQTYWALTFFEALEQALADVDAEYEEAKAEVEAYRADEKGA